jgi:hypothetical protein
MHDGPKGGVNMAGTKTQKEPLLITLQQGAAESGVPYTSLRKLVLDGHLARVQLGDSRRTWIKRVDLERLISNSTSTADQE